MNKLAYDCFFEKVAFNPLLRTAMKALSPEMRDLAFNAHRLMKPATQIIPKAAAPSALSKAMVVVLPVGFVASSGFSSAGTAREGVYGMPSAKSLPQTAPSFRTF
jgi:hypothetical protein